MAGTNGRVSPTKENKEQILSVKNLDCFGDDNFADFTFDKIQVKITGLNGETNEHDDKKSIGSDSPTDIMSDTSDVTARVTDSQSDTDDTKSNYGSDTQSDTPAIQFTIHDDTITDSPHRPSAITTSASPHHHILPPPQAPPKGTTRSRETGIVVHPVECKDMNRSQAKVLNFDEINNRHNVNRGIAKNINSTAVQDDTSKYFTVIHDVPQGRPCKMCPKMQLANLRDWWKVQQNVAPRTRHSIHIALVVFGSALLLLAIFLLARLPSSPKDVLRPFMYDLPPDDSFRPAPTLPWGAPGDDPHDRQRLDESEMKGQDFHDSYPQEPSFVRPAPLPSLREVAHRKGPFSLPKNSKQMSEMEVLRRYKMSNQPRNTSYSERAFNVALQLVRNTVTKERKEMEGKEVNIWEEGATPLRILLVSTWRSGSTFLGQVLQQHPGVFQHYEPFSYMGVRQIRSGTDAFQSQQLLHRLLDCRFKGQDQYLNYSKLHPTDMVGHNKRIWMPCNFDNYLNICSNSSFLTETCNMFPIQLVKTVRLRLNLTQLFLGENRLNAKVVYLVRDPRATINSRLSSVDWCSESSDCSSPEVLCSDLKEDLKVSAAFERLFPNSFIRIRYEDLANHPDEQIQHLLNFLGMEYTDKLAEFVKEHTQSDVEAPWSVARKSAARVDRWKENLSAEKIKEIESVCRPVLEKLDYKIAE